MEIMPLVRGFSLMLLASFLLYGTTAVRFRFPTQLRLGDHGGYQGETYIKGLSEYGGEVGNFSYGTQGVN